MSPGAVLRLAGFGVALLALIASAAWGALALGFKAGESTRRRRLCAAAWCSFALGALAIVLAGRAGAGLALYAVGFASLLAWWRRLAPCGTHRWADDVARLACGAAEGDRVTLFAVRDFRWLSPREYEARWEERSYSLERLRSLDMILSYWRGPAIAHAQFSFGFDDGEQVVFSVEVRRRQGEEFSEIGGFFKQFELCIIAAQERDSVFLRTNVRREEAYLYRVSLPPNALRSLFLAYVDEANRLEREPRFYHTIGGNCTTLVYLMMQRIVGRLPLDLRLLFSGYLPQYVYRLGALDGRYPFAQLHAAGRITERARASGGAAFSADIRRGVPGIEAPPPSRPGAPVG